MKDTSRRGGKLRDHILWVAKDVFLELGFERASMDAVASRAETSKRSLYAHFASKEKLFLAFFELLCGMFLDRLGTPGDYAEEPAEALVLFCGRYLELLLYNVPIRMCRLSMAEAARFPDASADSFDVIFSAAHDRLGTYLAAAYGWSPAAAADAAERLLARVLHPRFPRTLFGVDPMRDTIDVDTLSPDFDLAPIRRAVADVITPAAKARAGVPARRRQAK